MHQRDFFKPMQLESLKVEQPMPLYHRLYQLLRQIICDGQVSHGELLPTEKQLQQETGVSRVTIKRALKELALEGLVVRRRGVGTVVSYTPPPLNAIHAPLTSMLESLEQMGLSTDIRVLDIALKSPPRTIARAFEDTAPLLFISRTRAHQGQVFSYYESWSRTQKIKPDAGLFTQRPRLQLLREAGLEFSHIRQSISAVAATADIALHLGIPFGSPLLHLKRFSHDGQRQMVDYLDAYYNPEFFEYQMELHPTEQSAAPKKSA